MSTTTTWLITGVSSGIGHRLAVAALERGDTVIGTLRQPDAVAAFDGLAPGRSFGVQLDVTDRDAVRAVIPGAIDARGGIDVLVNNAGYALTGALEEYTDDEIAHQIDTNFLGTAAVIAAALPAMRERGGGKIINISSQAGIIGYPGLSMYCASKFAVEGLSESLRHELAPFGIAVTVVEPGGFRTDWAGRSMTYAAQPADQYRQLADAMRRSNEQMDGHQPGDPAKAASALLELADLDKPPLRVQLGSDAFAAISKKWTRSVDAMTEWQTLAASTDFANGV